jgi:hypothetical protein
MHTLKFQASKDQKAKFRKGQLVRCDYYPGVILKVFGKTWDQNGTLFYSLVVDGTTETEALLRGLREKYLRKA